MHVIDSLSVGGAERMLIEIANRTGVDGHRVSVCITRSDYSMATYLRPDISTYILGRQRRFDWKAIRKFAFIVHAKQVDILQAHSRTTLAFLALTKTLGLIKVPIILHDHYGGIEIDSSIPIWFRLWAKHLISHYVGVYAKLGEWAESAGINPNKISVIENALDLSAFLKPVSLNIRQELNIPANMPLGIVIGGIRKEKGIDILLKVLAQGSFRRHLKILVVGGERDKDYAQNCRKERNQLGLEDCVIFLGERHDVPDLLGEADFGLIPSRSESGPLVLIEYMASALPFISTLVGGIAKRLSELGIPEFVPPNDSKAFAEALDSLLRLSKSKRRERGSAGKEVALGNFDINIKIPQWYKIYERTLQAIR